MADEVHVIRGVDWKAVFPFTQIFRSFKIAAHPSKIFLALIALLAIYVGGKVLDAVWLTSQRALPEEIEMYAASREQPDPNGTFTRVRDTRLRSDEESVKRILDSIKPGATLGDYKGRLKTTRDDRVVSENAAYAKISDKTPEVKRAHEDAIRASY